MNAVVNRHSLIGTSSLAAGPLGAVNLTGETGKIKVGLIGGGGCGNGALKDFLDACHLHVRG
ncbi:MAG: hypothetical protein NTW21_33445 [Verrucomicrobia bacterium]|nr:hypothetical protein [Verrucomicrobiota bacterium]